MSVVSNLPSIQIDLNYSEIKNEIKEFLIKFEQRDSYSNEDIEHEVEKQTGKGFKYQNLLQKVANRESDVINIELEDLKNYEENLILQGFKENTGSSSLVKKIYRNTNRFIELFSSVIDEIMPEADSDVSYMDDVLDVILYQRKLQNLRLQNENEEEIDGMKSGFGFENNQTGKSDADNLFPAKLVRRYNLYFVPCFSNQKFFNIRQVNGQFVGQYITLSGIVTRVSSVKPNILVSAYTCDKCGYEIFQEVNSKYFTPLSQCTSQSCKTDNIKGQLFMSTRASKFSSFQEVKIQELSDQIPVGHIPRTMSVHLNGRLVRSMNPGDIVNVSGIYMPAPHNSHNTFREGLLTETYLEAQYVFHHKKTNILGHESQEIKKKIDSLIESGDIYEKLAFSICPEIYGHSDIKKILLLLLCGGVTKDLDDGMKIRGEINVCLMGDPGVAKSQLLKAITKVSPRSVYTTGKGSSGVGLTAAVMRDPTTDEIVLEGGALVLSDNGICCIDEFDKMDDYDRTAIHEVMEQQTISISKAGITTTLNARTSILAAANPVYGRYNSKLSPYDNINLPAALLSRFDIVYLVLDRPSREIDEKLAYHVTHVHMYNKEPVMDFEPLSPEIIREYIARSKEYNPSISKKIANHIVQTYIKMRKEAKKNEDSIKKFVHVSPRTLLGIIRLSQACAKLRLDNKVSFNDVEEALRLINVSNSSLYTDFEKIDNEPPTSKIYQIIRSIALQDNPVSLKTLSISDLKLVVIAKGYTLNQFEDCLIEYDSIGVWQKINNNESLIFIAENDSDHDMQ